MIQMKEVSFQYADSSEGVSAINLTVADGECVVLTGPSGGGKTTLTRLINGLAPSYYTGTLTGDIFLDGKPLSQIPQSELVRQAGSVFQDPKSQFFPQNWPGRLLLPAKTMDCLWKKSVSAPTMLSLPSP